MGVCMEQRESLLRIEFKEGPANSTTQLPLVFIHGWASNNLCWQKLVKDLQKQHNLYLIELPGCGQNTTETKFELSALLNEVKAALPEQCYLIGWSLGGMLALQVASYLPERVVGVLTIASNLVFTEKSDWPWAMPKQTFQDFFDAYKSKPVATLKRFKALQLMGDENRTALSEILLNIESAHQKIGSIQWLTLLNLLGEIDNRDLVQNLSLPVLHVFGEKDALVPASAAEEIKKQYPSQQVELLPFCGHAIPLSKPKELLKIINAFVLKNSKGLDFENNLAMKKESHRKSFSGKLKVAQAFSEAASSYDSAADLQKRVAGNLISHLGEGLQLSEILDLGCGTGFVSEGLLEKYSASNLYLLDLSLAMLNKAQQKIQNQYALEPKLVLADMDNLPLGNKTFDLIISSMSLQWSENLGGLFQQSFDCLKNDGRFLFSTVGPKTLQELAKAWKTVDDYVHVNSFASAEEIVKRAEKFGFICDFQKIDLEIQFFENVVALMRSLKSIGAHTVNTGQNHGLTSRGRLSALAEAYREFQQDRGLPATWEIYYFSFHKMLTEKNNH